MGSVAAVVSKYRAESHIRHHEVAIQRGAPLREEEGRGGEDQEEVPRQSPRHRGEESQGQDRRPGQEEVPRSLRSHRRPVLLPHPEEDQPEAGGRSLLLCQQRDPPYLRHHGLTVPGMSQQRSVILATFCAISSPELAW